MLNIAHTSESSSFVSADLNLIHPKNWLSKWVSERASVRACVCALVRSYLLAHLFIRSLACSPMFTNFVLRTRRMNEHTQSTVYNIYVCMGLFHIGIKTHLSNWDYTIYELFLRICLVIVVQIPYCCYVRVFFGFAHQNAWLYTKIIIITTEKRT